MLEYLSGSSVLLPALAAFAAAICGVYGLFSFIEPDPRLRRLQPATNSMPKISVRKGGGRLERLASSSLGSKFAPSDEREQAGLRRVLIQAGYDSPDVIQAYYGFRVLLALALGVAALILVPIAVPRQVGSLLFTVTVFAAVLGFMAPVFWVRSRRSRRQRKIREGLPHVLDLLLVCTEAGLGLDMAIARVGDEFARTHPILSEQLGLISAELRAGRPRADAFRGFAERTGVQEVNSLVNLLIQSDLLGTSMASTLRVFATDMRDHQLLKAEELAQKVTAKLSLVLVGCFMPALIIAIIAPIIFNIVATWRGIPL